MHNVSMEKAKQSAGRPKKPDTEVLVQKSIRMTLAQWEKIEAVGIDGLRRFVSKWQIKEGVEK